MRKSVKGSHKSTNRQTFREKMAKLPDLRAEFQLVPTGDFSQHSSPKFLAGSQVHSCNKVILVKGQSQAIPFFRKLKNTKDMPSSFYSSWSHDIHQLHADEHAGMPIKRLIPYAPDAMRNRLGVFKQKSIVRNGSQFEIGDRSFPYARHFLTTYKNYYTPKDNSEHVSNLGIFCNRTIWKHKLLER